ncbi:DNA primase [Pilimelia terevasa]|nr:DNA primase [Pilimelia terevasa]
MRSDADESGAPAEDVRADDTPRALWTASGLTPVEIALPAGAGYTLRTYQPSASLPGTDVEGRELDEDLFSAPEEDDEEVVILDEEFAAALAEEEAAEAADADPKGRKSKAGEDAAKDAEPAAAEGADEAGDAGADDAEEEPGGDEEVPFFLTHRGSLLLFKTPEALVSFIRSGAPHDLSDLGTWADMAEGVTPEDIVVGRDDMYELDLVVENLRGGHDTWDLDLLIRSGEVARDLGYALRLRPVLTALSPGSPLDDLDDAMRAASDGGMRGYFGRRRMRKIGAQQASLGWRTIIGKISAVVDWRD